MSLISRAVSSLAALVPERAEYQSLGLKAVPFPASGSGGTGYSPGWSGSSPLRLSAIDYKQVDAMGSAIVMMCVNSITRVFPEAPFQVMKRKKGGDPVPAGDHPLAALIARPNPYMSADEFWAATLVDYETAGNAYWLKVRDRLGLVAELYPIPAGLMRARWPREGSEFISYYEVWTSNRWERLEADDVVHFRNGLDFGPGMDGRYGLSPLRPAMRDVYTDEEGGNFSATMLRNTTGGIVLTPKQAVTLSPTDKLAMKAAYEMAYGGDNRGRPMVFEIPFDVNKVAFSPDEMNVTELREKCEERISGLLNVPPIVAGLGVGLKHMTYENYEQSVRLLWVGNIRPKHRAFCGKIDLQLLPDFPDPEQHLSAFDVSQIEALQENREMSEKRAASGLSSGALTVNEYRARNGEQPLAEGDVLYVPNTHKATAPEDLLAEPEPAPAPVMVAPAEPRLRAVKAADDDGPSEADWPEVDRVLSGLGVDGLDGLLYPEGRG
jgi:HK97 family phage portal protein